MRSNSHRVAWPQYEEGVRDRIACISRVLVADQLAAEHVVCKGEQDHRSPCNWSLPIEARRAARPREGERLRAHVLECSLEEHAIPDGIHRPIEFDKRDLE